MVTINIGDVMVKKIEHSLIIGILIYIFLEFWQIGKVVKIIVDASIPIFIGVFISFLIEPIIGFFERKNISRKVGCLLAYGMIFAIVGLVAVVFLPMMFSQLKDVTSYFPQMMNYIEDLNPTINSRIMSIGENVFSKIKDVFTSLSLIGIGVGASLYLSFDFEKIKLFYYDLAPMNYRKKYRIVSKEMGNAIFMYLRYMLYDTLLFFLISSVLLYLFNVPYPLAFSLLLAFTNLIPYIGPYIGMVPFVLFGFLNNQGLLCLFLSFFIQDIYNNLISPLLLKNMIYLHPVLGIFSMSLFGSLFGFWGLLFSRLLAILIKILVEHLFLLEKNPKMVYNSSEIDDKDK